MVEQFSVRTNCKCQFSSVVVCITFLRTKGEEARCQGNEKPSCSAIHTSTRTSLK